MPREKSLEEVSVEDAAFLGELFNVTDLPRYAEFVEVDAGLKFSLADTYASVQGIVDVECALNHLNSYESIPTSFKNKHKKKKKACTLAMPEDVLSTANYLDNKSVFEAMEALHPELLQFIDEHFIPPKGVSQFDATNEANIARNLFLTSDPLVKGPKSRQPDCNSLVMMGDCYAYVDPNGAELVRGGPVDVFAYVVDMDKDRAYKVYTQLCALKENRKILGGVDSYGALLRMFRHERRLAKSLDKLSKISQLKRADQDAPYFWFDDLHIDFLILHPNLPLQVKARYQRSKQAYLEEYSRIPEGAAYVVDITRGGVEGASANDYKMLKEIEEKCEYAYIHMYLEVALVSMPIVLVGKPRPHNHTAVFYYDKDNEPFSLLEFELLLEDVQQANEKRNARLYGVYQSHFTYPMPPHNLILDMVTYVRNLWLAADDVHLTKRAMENKRDRRNKNTWLDIEEHIYQELSETFSCDVLPAYVTMYPPRDYYTMVTKPLRCFVKGDVAKKVQFNMIMSVTEGKRARFFGEWWFVNDLKRPPKQRYVVRGVEERVYKQLSASAPIDIKGKRK